MSTYYVWKRYDATYSVRTESYNAGSTPDVGGQNSDGTLYIGDGYSQVTGIKGMAVFQSITNPTTVKLSVNQTYSLQPNKYVSGDETDYPYRIIQNASQVTRTSATSNSYTNNSNSFNLLYAIGSRSSTYTTIYTTRSNAYTSGYNGAYFYEYSTSIVSPMPPSNLSYTSIINTNTVSITWNQGTSSAYPIKMYNIYYATNGLANWKLAGGTSNTFYQFTMPSNSYDFSTIQFRVATVDTNGGTSTYIEGQVATVLPPPPYITVPQIVMENNNIEIAWGSIDNVSTYILQRKINNGEWEQVYSGNATTYSDTSGNWESVQYQVCGVFTSYNGIFAISNIINVVTQSALQISGIDQDLGVIYNNIPYSVATDTGNPINLTRTVNGILVASLTVSSGFSYEIPVMDLPTGVGTIIITATVETDSDPVTVTRTWTYTKVAQEFPGAGGLSQLQQDGQNIFPLTLAEAVKAIGGPWGGNLSTALEKLARATVFNRDSVPKYAEVEVNLSNAKVGDIVNLPENEVMVPFYVASLDYEPTLNTNGARVLLVRKNVYQNGAWNASGVNTYANSTIDTWFNSTYKPMLDSKVLAEIGETTFHYTPGNGSNEVTTLARAVFALSLTELGISGAYANVEGNSVQIASILQIAQMSGSAVSQWTRTPRNDTNYTFVYRVMENGFSNDYNVTGSFGYRPCFTLPATFQSTFLVDINGTVHPEQEYTTAEDFTDLWGNVIPTIKISTGSYTGTGTYGTNNKNQLTFNFIPKLLVVQPVSTGYYSFAYVAYGSGGVCLSTRINTSFTSQYLYGSNDGNSISWYSANADAQANTSGVVYRYFAIG